MIAWHHRCHTRSDFKNGPCGFGTGNVWQGPLMMAAPVKTGTIINVKIVDAGSFDLDENFAGVGFWRRDFLVAENFGPAELMDADSFHRRRDDSIVQQCNHPSWSRFGFPLDRQGDHFGGGADLV